MAHVGSTAHHYCERCRNAAFHASGEDVFESQGVSIRFQVEIFRCRFCGAWWEFPSLGWPGGVDPEVAREKLEGTWKP